MFIFGASSSGPWTEKIDAIRHWFVWSVVSAVKCQRLGGRGFLSVGKPLSGATIQSSVWLRDRFVEA